MSKNSVVGFPRIGEKRELKFAIEKYLAKECDFEYVQNIADTLKCKHWRYQKDAGIDIISSNDFSYYDNMLDTIVMLGCIPQRFYHIANQIEQYFAMARGYQDSVAMSMTKWFNTNYHYIVPELYQNQEFVLNSSKIALEYNQAKTIGIKTKINIIGPVTFLALSHTIDGSDKFLLFNKLLDIYVKLLQEISTFDDEIIVQFDEPYFVKDTQPFMLALLKQAYERLGNVADNIKVVVTSYFEHSIESTSVLLHTPIWAIGLDFVAGSKNIESLELIAKSNKTLFAGVINGRNIWRNDLDKTLTLLDHIASKVSKSNIIISSSCSLLHSPYSLKYEDKLDSEIKSWLSFALEKLDEIVVLSNLFFNEPLSNAQKELVQISKQAIANKMVSSKIHNISVQKNIENITKWQRDENAKDRLAAQRQTLNYPILATTTIGSFPQTSELRNIRKEYKNGIIDNAQYDAYIKSYINDAIKIQEDIGLDILVHGEPERGDMVEYFGELMNGFAFTQNGWVQSYGARCVKPPLIFGDISIDSPMTVQWITYAQSQTQKILKGMLTGPVTIINWSFVRDDIQKSKVAYQIALCLAKEIEELQTNGIKIIQVDEAAFKEGYPLRADKIKDYEEWAIKSFRLCVSSAMPQTQIHTHMCYSEFDDIIDAIDAMDADVITIETAKGGNRILTVFKDTGYSKELGLGVYDIHSPRIPSVLELKEQIKLLLQVLPKERLWINPDCGLKTRKWDEVIPSLKNMVEAARSFR